MSRGRFDGGRATPHPAGRRAGRVGPGRAQSSMNAV
jgi:hypothetical protein